MLERLGEITWDDIMGDDSEDLDLSILAYSEPVEIEPVLTEPVQLVIGGCF